MISKVQGKELRGEAVVATRPKLTPLERGMLTWAVLDPGDKVLDANTRDGLMLEYLYRNMECEICGISFAMENVKQARSRLQNADIIYAHPEDIPWRENSFDAVLLHRESKDGDAWQNALTETMRVLKPGGQFLMGTICYPSPIRQIANYFSNDRENDETMVFQSKAEMMEIMQAAGYQQITWQQVNLVSGVLIGWKPLAEENADGESLQVQSDIA